MEGFLRHVIDNWQHIVIGVALVAVVAGAVTARGKQLAQKLWAVIFPLLIPLALVGAVEMWNKIQIGVVGRPWIVMPRVEQPEQYQDYDY
jgi:hypothetical protein